MKKIEAIIRHHRLDMVKNALSELGVTGLTVCEVRGCGRQKGHVETYRGIEYNVDLLPKIKLEIIANENLVPGITKAIVDASRTGEIGDGKIFISELEECVRIRTGESGVGAV